MNLPDEFSADAKARLTAAKLRAKRIYFDALRQPPPKHETCRGCDERAFREYILCVFYAFSKEALELCRQGSWSSDLVASECEEFIRSFSSEAYWENGYDRSGARFSEPLTHWGDLREDIARFFYSSDQWSQFQAELELVAESKAHSKIGHGTNQKSARRAQVDKFLAECNAIASVEVQRQHIWKAARHKTARQFELWQAEHLRATKQDDKSFHGILSLTPKDFLSLLEKQQILHAPKQVSIS